MPKRLKRAIGRLAGKKTSRPSAQASPSGEGDHGADQTSFLNLPPEIRNQIYYELAADTTLVLRPTKSKKPPPQNGLLLACKQTRAEFKKLLLANAQVEIWISEYHFNNVIRVFETLPLEDLDILKLNPDIWMLLQISHVPSRDDRRNLRGWSDYRSGKFSHSYFGPNHQTARDFHFEYDVRFSAFLRAPQSANRYFNRHDMKLDLLRTHYRMFQRLRRESFDNEEPSEEFEKLTSDVEDCVRRFEELQVQRSSIRLRSASVCTA